MKSSHKSILLIVHGGAGSRRPHRKSLDTIAESLAAGYTILLNRGPALDAVATAIAVLENSGLFNAGLGGVLQLDGVQRLDASLMEGRGQKAGAVAGLEGIRNPILAARRVMDTGHVLLANIGARQIARGLPFLPKPSPESRKILKRIIEKDTEIGCLYRRYFGTVGAVALDSEGNVAAGTSTGGTHAMLPGRIGDSPIIGSGTYAENRTGAVSCTGSGEYILRRSLAKEVCMMMQDLPPSLASRRGLQGVLRIGGQAGVIALNAEGRFTIMHTTDYMTGGYAKNMRIQVQEGFQRTG